MNKKTILSKESMAKYTPDTGQPPYCPECQSENITVDPTGTMVEDRELIEMVSCLNCYLKWQEVYKFSHITYHGENPHEPVADDVISELEEITRL